MRRCTCSAAERVRRRSPAVQRRDRQRRQRLFMVVRLDRTAGKPVRSVLRFTICGSVLALSRFRVSDVLKRFDPRTTSKDLATDGAPEHAAPYTYRPNGKGPFGMRRIPG